RQQFLFPAEPRFCFLGRPPLIQARFVPARREDDVTQVRRGTHEFGAFSCPAAKFTREVGVRDERQEAPICPFFTVLLRRFVACVFGFRWFERLVCAQVDSAFQVRLSFFGQRLFVFRGRRRERRLFEGSGGPDVHEP